MTPQERIKADAERYTKDEGYQRVYIAGATAENSRVQQLVDMLMNVRAFIAGATAGAMHPFTSLITLGKEVEAAIQQWEGGKEVEQEVTTCKLSTEEKKKLLANKIESRMKEAGLQRQEFADLMGTQPSTITRWLSGEHNFQIDTLFELERQLNIKLFNY